MTAIKNVFDKREKKEKKAVRVLSCNLEEIRNLEFIVDVKAYLVASVEGDGRPSYNAAPDLDGIKHAVIEYHKEHGERIAERGKWIIWEGEDGPIEIISNEDYLLNYSFSHGTKEPEEKKPQRSCYPTSSEVIEVRDSREERKEAHHKFSYYLAIQLNEINLREIYNLPFTEEIWGAFAAKMDKSLLMGKVAIPANIETKLVRVTHANVKDRYTDARKAVCGDWILWFPEEAGVALVVSDVVMRESYVKITEVPFGEEAQNAEAGTDTEK